MIDLICFTSYHSPYARDVEDCHANKVYIIQNKTPSISHKTQSPFLSLSLPNLYQFSQILVIWSGNTVQLKQIQTDHSTDSFGY